MMIADQGTAGASPSWPGLIAPVSMLEDEACSAVPQRGAHVSSAGAGDMALGLQPRHALCGGMLRGAEAVLRRGTACVPAGAGAGGEASARMSFWLLEAACREAQLWNAASGAWSGAAFPVMVSVDMPARSLREGRLPAEVCLALERSGLAPHLLEIALPEYAATDGSTEVLLGMSALRDLGVGLALDRFGSVSASLRLLQRLPLTAVKLDPGLTRDLVHDRAIRKTLAAAIGLAHAMHTNVVATGVDSVSQRDILADMGCDDAQGNQFGAPMAPACFHEALRGALPEELQ